MSSVVRVWSGVCVLTLSALVPVAAAQSDKFQAAVALYDKHEYQAAQTALLAVDRQTLNEGERQRLDELLRTLPEAIKASEKGKQDQTRADEAYDAGEWQVAEQLYRVVEGNKFLPDDVRKRAVDQCARIAEKKKLAEAAQPKGTVPQPATPLKTAEKPTPQPAAEEVVPAAAEPAPPLESEPRRVTPTDELRMRDELLWQRAVAIAEALTAEIHADMAGNEFASARKKMATALQSIEAAARYAEPVAKYQTARDGLLKLQEELERAAEAHALKSADEQRLEIKKRIEERKKQIEAQKAETVMQMFNSVDQLRRERRFGEAAEVLREVLRIDPSNAEARYQLNWAEDLESFDQQRRWYDDKAAQGRQALINAEEALIPWDVDVMYPRNWLELAARRTKLGLIGGRDLGDVELERQLTATLPDVRFEETAFDQFIALLGEMTKLNLAVDWTDLTDNGVERDNPVTVQLSNVTVRTMLSEVLTQVGGDVQLAYTVGDGLVRIATKAKLDRDKLALIYDIRDLLIDIPRAARSAGFDVSQGLGQGGAGGAGGGGGGGAGGGMFGQGQQRQQQQQGRQGEQARDDLVRKITEIIQETVEPDSWREGGGGGDGSIQELQGQLIVYNTSDAHRQVDNLLDQLRETQALQISVETRFLNVISNFLEEFGVDLDFVFNAGTAGYDQGTGTQGVLTDPATGAVVLVPRDFSRIGTFASSPAFGQPFTAGAVPQQPYGQAAFVPAEGGLLPRGGHFTPIGMQQSSLDLARPAISTGVPGSFATRAGVAPALNIAGSFLDNIQVDFLIRATQANSRSSVVQAPRLVLFNGQASSISVGRSRTYVSSLEPRLAEGAVGFQPITSRADSGVYLFVDGTISADRKYVTLTLDVRQRDEPTLERFEVQRASGNSPGAFISLPDYNFATLSTTVSIPDGGTVLLGGLKQAGEVEVDAGVPILSKIPVLKRAFSNQTTIKDTLTLLILVKTKIIIQKEAEEEAFPTFTHTGS